MPKVSVVIPCFNCGELLTETLDSLQAQTFTDFEIIVVNDGSTDKATVALLQNISQTNTRVFHTVNRGVSAARNKGISEARGCYILPLDADDKIGPEYLELAVNVLEASKDSVAVYFERVLFGEREGVAPLSDYDAAAILTENCIYAALFKQTDWDAVGGFCEKMVYGWEDWDFWISLSERGTRFVKIPEPQFYYRIRSNSRDHSLRLYQKIAMITVIIFRHKCLYLQNMNQILKSAVKIMCRKAVQR